MTTLQDKLAAIQWPKDIERIAAWLRAQEPPR